MKRRALVVAIPLLLGLIVAAALVLRPRSDPQARSIAARREVRSDGSRPVHRRLPEKPASDAIVARAVETERIRATFDNYRTAVATEDGALQEALRPVLLRDRDVAVAMAQGELDSAVEPFDTQIAQRVLATLRR